MKLKIQLGKKNLEVFQKLGQPTIDAFLQMSEEELTTEIKKETPVDYGKLRGSWTPKRSKTQLKVSNSRNYAVYVEKGTGLFAEGGGHMITPKNSSVFHARIDGDDVFFTQHKGMKGHKMTENGVKTFKTRIPSLFRQAIIKTSGSGK